MSFIFDEKNRHKIRLILDYYSINVVGRKDHQIDPVKKHPYLKMNQQYLSHVGYGTQRINDHTNDFFSSKTSELISSEVTGILRDFYPPGITLPSERIIDVMNSIFINYVPSATTKNVIPDMMNQAIEVIVNDIKNLLSEQQSRRKQVLDLSFNYDPMEE